MNYEIFIMCNRREDPRDCVILHEKHKGLSLKTLPEGCLIGKPRRIRSYLRFYAKYLMYHVLLGTSSLRRTAQICHKFPQLKIESIRGNLNTRLRKLNDGLFDGIILALAGIERMNWRNKISEVIRMHNQVTLKWKFIKSLYKKVLIPSFVCTA